MQPAGLVCILPFMQINMIAVGNKMPAWVEQGYQEYAKRLPHEYRLILKEINPGKRGKNSDTARIVRDEGQRMLQAVPAGAHVVTLDIPGKPWSTEQLAKAMQRWQQNSQQVALMIGGPEGLSDQVREQAQESWSLSPLTFPHPLVRVIVAEQIYRAFSILKSHPYHR